MKISTERLNAFNDAVIAIIITLMALDLPVVIKNNTLQLRPLFLSIGIYFISFCFAANNWYQHMTLFKDVKVITNSVVLINLIMLFFLSLVPTFTKMVIEHISKVSVVLYCFLYLLINITSLILSNKVARQRQKEAKISDAIFRLLKKFFYKRDILMIAFNILTLLLACFVPLISIICIIILIIWTFIVNGHDQLKFEDLIKMSVEGRERFLTMNSHQQDQLVTIMKQHLGNINKLSLSARQKILQQAINKIMNSFNISYQDAILWFQYANPHLFNQLNNYN